MDRRTLAMIMDAQRKGGSSTAGILTRRVRRLLRRLKWAPQLKRLEQLRGMGEGRRAFVVASGPSLRAMNLRLLDNDFVCVVNMAVRAIGHGLTHADMHIMNDTHGYERFSHEIETIARAHHIPHRFLNFRARKFWRRLTERAAEPVYIVPHTEKLAELGEVPSISGGLVSGGSVVITAAILLQYLGFDPIYLIGCDLDYEGDGKYFYDMQERDLQHEEDPVVVARRSGIDDVNAQFAVLKDDFASKGFSLLNAGVGGRLSSLPRVAFESLFDPAI
jgi:hypothetical protein